MIGGTVETSASFEARYAPLSYPTEGLGVKFPGPTRQRCRPLERWCSNAQRPSTQLEETDDGRGGHEGWTQTTRHCCLCRTGRPCLINRPCSRTGENPPYGIPGRAMETSASYEARSAPSLYPTAGPIRTWKKEERRRGRLCGLGWRSAGKRGQRGEEISRRRGEGAWGCRCGKGQS